MGGQVGNVCAAAQRIFIKGVGYMGTISSEAPYKFEFDEDKDVWVCSVHGEVDLTGWVNCWNGCSEGWFDDHEDDSLDADPGDMSTCWECKGEGGWMVCGECNSHNPDVEW
jgi:hypothetical protein